MPPTSLQTIGAGALIRVQKVGRTKVNWGGIGEVPIVARLGRAAVRYPLPSCTQPPCPALSVSVQVSVALSPSLTPQMIVLPAVVAMFTVSDETPLWLAFRACNTLIPPPPPPLELMVMLRALVAVWGLASLTCTVKLLVPVPVGVPVIAPVEEFRLRPAGRLPVVIDQV